MKKKISIIAAVFIFLGFGMIHGSSIFVEQTGSVLIGLGSLWLIIILLKSIFKKQNNETEGI